MYGNPTDGALLALSRKLNIHVDDVTRLEEIPFSHDQKWMGVRCSHKATVRPDIILSDQIGQNGSVLEVFYILRHHFTSGYRSIMKHFSLLRQNRLAQLIDSPDCQFFWFQLHIIIRPFLKNDSISI